MYIYIGYVAENQDMQNYCYSDVWPLAVFALVWKLVSEMASFIFFRFRQNRLRIPNFLLYLQVDTLVFTTTHVFIELPIAIWTFVFLNGLSYECRESMKEHHSGMYGILIAEISVFFSFTGLLSITILLRAVGCFEESDAIGLDVAKLYVVEPQLPPAYVEPPAYSAS